MIRKMPSAGEGRSPAEIAQNCSTPVASNMVRFFLQRRFKVGQYFHLNIRRTHMELGGIERKPKRDTGLEIQQREPLTPD